MFTRKGRNMTATAATYQPPTYQFIPQGHMRIMPFRVLAAWHHKESGAWLSIQSLGPAMAVVWRTSDDYAALPMLVYEVCDSLDRDDNFRRAKRVAEYMVEEGPPADLLENSRKSAEVRSEKARKAANARHAKNGVSTTETPTDAKSRPATVDVSKELEKGPRHDKAKWKWGKMEPCDIRGPLWSLDSLQPDEVKEEQHFDLVYDRYGCCDLERRWWIGDKCFKDMPVREGTLKECYEVIEKLSSIPWRNWHIGQFA